MSRRTSALGAVLTTLVALVLVVVTAPGSHATRHTPAARAEGQSWHTVLKAKGARVQVCRKGITNGGSVDVYVRYRLNTRHATRSTRMVTKERYDSGRWQVVDSTSYVRPHSPMIGGARAGLAGADVSFRWSLRVRHHAKHMRTLTRQSIPAC